MAVTHIAPRTAAPLPQEQPGPVEVPDALPTTPDEEAKACRCGHVAAAHEHYRRGKDCAVCGCLKYRRKRRRD